MSSRGDLASVYLHPKRWLVRTVANKACSLIPLKGEANIVQVHHEEGPVDAQLTWVAKVRLNL